MATFNPMHAASPGDAMALNMASAGLGIEGFDPELQFDESMLTGHPETYHHQQHHHQHHPGGDALNGGLSAIPFTPSYDFDTFSTTFEDPFHYPRPYEAAPNPEEFQDGESSPQQPDDKLLGFSATVIKASPFDDSTGTYSEPNMAAELYGMFFVAEDVFGGETTGRPLELTCYRRNLWQCSGHITMPRHCTQVLNEQGRAIPVVEFYASISAIESIEGKATEIISIPWKSSNPAIGEGQESKVAGAPPKVLLDLSGGQEVDGHRVTVPVSWKRLQFKSATANNGRRKGLQQHYVVQISLLAKMKAGGELMKVAEIQSGPVIVRGRSPRNFDSKKDVPLSGDKKPQPGDSRARSGSDASTTPVLKSERTDLSSNLHRYHSLGNVVQTPTAPSGEWNTPSTPSFNHQQHPAKRAAISPPMNRPPVPTWHHETTPSKSQISKQSTVSSVPINLSLSEDERSPNNRANSASSQSPRLNRASTNQGRVGSPTEDADMLYEYFPLSVDDWTPLVDTVYRPHIVHHIAVPQEIKAQRIRSKSKRYFSAE